MWIGRGEKKKTINPNLARVSFPPVPDMKLGVITVNYGHGSCWASSERLLSKSTCKYNIPIIPAPWLPLHIGGFSLVAGGIVSG